LVDLTGFEPVTS